MGFLTHTPSSAHFCQSLGHQTSPCHLLHGPLMMCSRVTVHRQHLDGRARQLSSCRDLLGLSHFYMSLASPGPHMQPFIPVIDTVAS
jgi:hypothetical protein